MTASQTIESHAGFRSLRPGPLSGMGGFLATIAIHGGLVFMMWWSQRMSAEPEAGPRDVIITQMVKLGKPREKFWLPRIAQPRPTTTPDQLKITDDPNARPAPIEAPKPENADVSNKLRKALERARLLEDADNEPEEGLATGSTAGTANEATTGDEYATKVFTAIRENWSVPVGLVPDQELAALTATVKLHIEADGKLAGVELTKPSGNALFDDSCLAAIKATGKVPPPPPALQKTYARGVVMPFKQ